MGSAETGTELLWSDFGAAWTGSQRRAWGPAVGLLECGVVMGTMLGRPVPPPQHVFASGLRTANGDRRCFHVGQVAPALWDVLEGFQWEGFRD